MTPGRYDYPEVLETARKYATGFRDFSLPDATFAIAGQLGYPQCGNTAAGGWFRRYVKRAMDQLAGEGMLTAYPRGEELPEGGVSLYREYRTPAPETVPDPEPWDDENGTAQARSDRLAAAFRDWFGLPAIAMPSIGIDGARAGVWLDGETADRVMARLKGQEDPS